MRKFWTILFFLIPALGTIGFIVAFAGNAWLPLNISTTGWQIDFLFYVILWITGIFFVLTEILLVIAMYRGRGRSNGKADFYHGHHGLEIGWTLMTAVILLFVAFVQMPAWWRAKYRSNMPNKDPVALVTASQFLWQVRYPYWDFQQNQPRKLNTRKPNLVESFELINELHVPATDASNDPNEQVVIHLTTRDVIHSFWLPNVRVKQDALPGHLIPVWFDATKPGTYEWTCAELCGWGHFRMRAKLVVHQSQEDYNNWLKEQTRRLTSVAAK